MTDEEIRAKALECAVVMRGPGMMMLEQFENYIRTGDLPERSRNA